MANIHSIAEISKNATVVEIDFGRQISNTDYCRPGSSRDTESRLEQETSKSACIPSNFQKIYISSNNKKNWKVTVHGINNRVFNEMQQSMLCNGIHASLYKNVYKLNYERSTIIQEYAMPIIMNGKDIIARTQNGSGKTTAIAISILDVLLKNFSEINVDSHRSDPLAIIVVPTKQRVQHIYNVIHRLSENTSIECGPLFNKSLSDQKNKIQKGVHIIIATPENLVGFVSQDLITFTALRIIVFDEADVLLTAGFKPEIEFILNNKTMVSTDKRTTVLFSTSMIDAVEQLAMTYLKPNYVSVDIKEIKEAADITQTI
ncbi:probable ATP-dependent RNA helicase DDX4 [Aphis gossypii]|uniref:probable ATP-dependent RNA helicase DDX4 n=1 Tax=Aphis gossypii TaxID=80765 RepID=UPI0021596CA8|nr:probable ATP-dependent RNA helicase DDX4 [Aphis gossypii]